MFSVLELALLRFVVQFQISNLDDEVESMMRQSIGLRKADVEIELDKLRNKLVIRLKQAVLELEVEATTEDDRELAEELKKRMFLKDPI